MSAVLALVVAVISLVIAARKPRWSKATSSRLSALVSTASSVTEAWVKVNRAAESWVAGSPVALVSARPAAPVRRTSIFDDGDDMDENPGMYLRDRPTVRYRPAWETP